MTQIVMYLASRVSVSSSQAATRTNRAVYFQRKQGRRRARKLLAALALLVTLFLSLCDHLLLALNGQNFVSSDCHFDGRHQRNVNFNFRNEMSSSTRNLSGTNWMPSIFVNA